MARIEDILASARRAIDAEEFELAEAALRRLPPIMHSLEPMRLDDLRSELADLTSKVLDQRNLFRSRLKKLNQGVLASHAYTALMPG